MNRFMLPAAMLGLSAAVLAQGFLTTPPGGLPNEGPDGAYVFGWFPDARYQQVDANHVGNKSYTITDIAFRMDSVFHTPDTGMGRSWTRITLDISETSNYENLSSVWSQNITHPTSRVFDSSWSWPTISGQLPVEPDVWGGSKGQLRFPFKQPWSYSGKQALLMDYTFRGGRLANAALWRGGPGTEYRLDSEHFYPNVRSGVTRVLPHGGSGCGPTTRAVAILMGGELPSNLGIGFLSTITENAIQAVGLGGSNTGVDIGAKCNRLYVDFSKPYALGAPSNQVHLIPWQPAYAGLKVWAQMAWTDSSTGHFSLTSATRLTLPFAPPPKQPPRYKTHYSQDPTSSASELGPVTSVGYYFPFTRYGIK